MDTAKVILFKRGGKYYTEEVWRVPAKAIGPHDMERSPDFRRIDGGPVLIDTQEPWGYPFLFPAVPLSMDPIVVLSGLSLEAFLAYMRDIINAHDSGPVPPYKLRIAIDEGAVKIKVDNHTWSRPLGEVEK